MHAPTTRPQYSDLTGHTSTDLVLRLEWSADQPANNSSSYRRDLHWLQRQQLLISTSTATLFITLSDTAKWTDLFSGKSFRGMYWSKCDGLGALPGNQMDHNDTLFWILSEANLDYTKSVFFLPQLNLMLALVITKINSQLLLNVSVA